MNGHAWKDANANERRGLWRRRIDDDGERRWR
jgi:hypothetical protein